MDLYFDHNATTPLSDAVKVAIKEAMEFYANPSSYYLLNKMPRKITIEAYQACAELLNCLPEQIVITSGATESNNFVIKSLLAGCSPQELASRHVISTAIEHPSIIEVLDYYQKQGLAVSLIKPDQQGRIALADVVAEIRPETCLITMMAINNETGVIQPFKELATIAAEKEIFFHVDAVQAVGKIPIDTRQLPGISTLSFSGHKFNAPKGIGGLYLAEHVQLTPLLHGGGQANGLRSGTENTLGLAGLSIAVLEAHQSMSARYSHYQQLRQALIKELNQLGIHYQINGHSQAEFQAPWTLNVSFQGIRAESLAGRLSLCYGISLSLGSACSNNKESHRSYVLTAMGLSHEQIDGAVRISFGHNTTIDEISELAQAINTEVSYLLSLSSKQKINELSRSA